MATSLSNDNSFKESVFISKAQLDLLFENIQWIFDKINSIESRMNLYIEEQNAINKDLFLKVSLISNIIISKVSGQAILPNKDLQLETKESLEMEAQTPQHIIESIDANIKEIQDTARQFNTLELSNN